MSERATFFNSENGDRIYNAESMRQYISTFFTDGIHQGELAPVFSSGMTIMIGSGYAVVKGDVQYFPSQTRITLSLADALYDRIDTIVLEHDENTREMTIKAVKGDYASTPEPKPPVRSDGIYQLVIAQISVPAATLALTQESITDTRSNRDICGYVASKFVDIDFSQLTAQFSKYFENTKATNLAAFNAWLENECVDISDASAPGMLDDLDYCEEHIPDIGRDMGSLVTDLSSLKYDADHTNISSDYKVVYLTNSASGTLTIKAKNVIGFIAVFKLQGQTAGIRAYTTIHRPVFLHANTNSYSYPSYTEFVGYLNAMLGVGSASSFAPTSISAKITLTTTISSDNMTITYATNSQYMSNPKASGVVTDWKKNNKTSPGMDVCYNIARYTDDFTIEALYAVYGSLG